MIDRNKDFQVKDWMLKNIGCKHKVLVFAFIYAFNNKEEKTTYKGNASRIAEFFGISRSYAARELKELENDRYIEVLGNEIKINWEHSKVRSDKTDSKEFAKVEGWMIYCNPNFNVKELLIYALIYGYTKAHKNKCYSKSVNEIAEFLNLKTNQKQSNSAVRQAIYNLKNDKLILQLLEEQTKGNVNYYVAAANINFCYRDLRSWKYVPIAPEQLPDSLPQEEINLNENNIKTVRNWVAEKLQNSINQHSKQIADKLLIDFKLAPFLDKETVQTVTNKMLKDYWTMYENDKN